MNRNKIEPINTLPWGRPAQSDTDAEWELLRASAVERDLPVYEHDAEEAQAEHEAYAEQLSYHPETAAAQSDEGEDEDEEAAWAAIYAQRQSQEYAAEEEAVAQQEAWEQQALAQQQTWAEQQARDEQRAWEEQQAWQQQQAYAEEQSYAEEQAYAHEQALLAEQQAYVQQQALLAQQQAYEHQQAYAQQQALLAQQHFEQQAWQQQQAYAQQRHAGYAQPSYGQRHAPVDPFAPVSVAGPSEPVAVHATPSVAPGQMRAPDLAAVWDDSPADFAPQKSGGSWVPKVLIGLAAAVAIAIGVQSMQAETERQAKVAAAEKARLELVQADQKRLAEEAHRAEIERLAAEGRAKAAAAAAAAAAPVVAPTAPRPTGVSRARPAKRHAASRGRKARNDANQQVAGEDSGSDRSNDPIFGL